MQVLETFSNPKIDIRHKEGRRKLLLSCYLDKVSYWFREGGQDGVRAFLKDMLGAELVEFFEDEKSDTQAIGIAYKNEVHLISRGTDMDGGKGFAKLKDWIENAKQIGHVDLPEGRVGKGYYETTGSIYPFINQWIRNNNLEKLAFWVHGHSKGGGEAVIYAYRLYKSGYKIAGGITAGGMRAVSKKFAKWFNANVTSNFFRIVNNNDIVTRLLPILLDHVGQEIYITRKSWVRTRYNFWEKLFDRFVGRLNDVGKLGTDGIKDHDITSAYIKGLESTGLRLQG